MHFNVNHISMFFLYYLMIQHILKWSNHVVPMQIATTQKSFLWNTTHKTAPHMSVLAHFAASSAECLRVLVYVFECVYYTPMYGKLFAFRHSRVRSHLRGLGRSMNTPSSSSSTSSSPCGWRHRVCMHVSVRARACSRLNRVFAYVCTVCPWANYACGDAAQPGHTIECARN